ncbi:MAG: CBS domain-containing protein [Planctomycetota bacterium]|jgi:CBS domain-containing protein
MTTSQIEVESQVIELSKQSLDTFWHEISAIFTVKSECNQQQVTVETAEALREHFDDLAAMISIKAEGSLNETFQIVFCQKGVFTLAGLMLMQSTERVLENIELASPETARQMTDAVAEAGHMLVGAFDRVFHKELAGYDSLALTDIYLGNPREESDGKIGLPSDGEFVLVPYEVRISSYPPFACSIVFPKAIVQTSSEPETEQPPVIEAKTQEPEVVPDKAGSENGDPAYTTQNEEAKLQEPLVENNTAEETALEENTAEESVAGQKAEANGAPDTQVDVEQQGNDTNTDTPNEEDKLQEPPEQDNATEETTPEEGIAEVSADEQNPEADSTPNSKADTEQQGNDTNTDTPNEEGKLQEPPEQDNATEETAPEEGITEASADDQNPEADSTPNSKADTEQQGNDTNTDTPIEEGKLQEPPEQDNATEETTPEEGITEASADDQDPEADRVPDTQVNDERETNDTGADAPVDVGDREAASQPKPAPPDEATSSTGPAPSQPNAISEVPGICAEQIMQKDLLWATQNDSVQQALTKIQQNDGTCLMIGQNETLEGIVSKSDLAGATSPYIRPIFAKWRRPMDDATLQIKMKWIMSTDIHTATPETPLGPIIEKMCQFGVRSLPVVDSQGKVQGLITASDVFKTLLTHMPDPSAASGDV